MVLLFKLDAKTPNTSLHDAIMTIVLNPRLLSPKRFCCTQQKEHTIEVEGDHISREIDQ